VDSSLRHELPLKGSLLIAAGHVAAFQQRPTPLFAVADL
jgi:hypothetical protein